MEFNAALLVPRIWRWLLDFWKICAFQSLNIGFKTANWIGLNAVEHNYGWSGCCIFKKWLILCQFFCVMLIIYEHWHNGDEVLIAVIENIAVFLDVKSYSQGDRSTVVRNVDTVLRCYTASRYRTQESSLSAQLILFAFSCLVVNGKGRIESVFGSFLHLSWKVDTKLCLHAG